MFPQFISEFFHYKKVVPKICSGKCIVKWVLLLLRCILAVTTMLYMFIPSTLNKKNYSRQSKYKIIRRKILKFVFHELNKNSLNINPCLHLEPANQEDKLQIKCVKCNLYINIFCCFFC